MTQNNPTLRETLNNGDANRLPNVFGDGKLGSLMAMLIAGLTPTEAGVVPTTTNPSWDFLNLANAAQVVAQVNATAGTFTGILALKINPDDNDLPSSGEVFWDGPGTTRLRFAKADAITAVSITYARADAGNLACSLLDRTLGQRD